MNPRSPSVLVVDDHAAVRAAVADYLGTHGCEVETAASVAQARERFRSRMPDAAVLDYDLGDGDALELLDELRMLDPACAILILTGMGSIDLAVRAMRQGADHFLTKPLDLEALRLVLLRALELRRVRRLEAAAPRAPDGAADPFFGRDPAIRRLRAQAERVRDSDQPVLILGETGAGKGVLARWLHANGPRAAEPLVDLNCAGFGRELVESELFGHVKGAFTGAISTKRGLFEVANRGTVFLDEIGDLDPAVQPKLLTAIEERRLRRVGDVEHRPVDIRLVSATSRDLGRLAEAGTFRMDLYYRISTIVLTVPPLRERVADIPGFAQGMLDAMIRRRPLRLLPEAVAALQAYPWPGNLRELRNVLERAVLLSDHEELRPEDLVFGPLMGGGREPGSSGPRAAATRTLAEMERHAILEAMQATGGKVTDAAARLDIPRSTLYAKLKAYGLASSKS